uniref:Uncharacterized protein n=1 Tax=Leersia perrieri TaxID=77586 RepID=A0A0D9WV72_9ORYZ
MSPRHIPPPPPSFAGRRRRLLADRLPRRAGFAIPKLACSLAAKELELFILKMCFLMCKKDKCRQIVRQQVVGTKYLTSDSVRYHLPDKMSGVIVPTLFADHGYCATYGSNPSFCIIASKLELSVAGVNSGNGASPSSFGSTVCGSDPLCQCWRTQSTSIFLPWCALLLIGHRPQVTSRRNVPKANTSVRGDAFPVCASSGAMNPMVPTRSLYENRCGPNSTSQSSLNSAYLICLLTSSMTTTKINAAATIGNVIFKIFCKLLSLGQGSLGNLAISIVHPYLEPLAIAAHEGQVLQDATMLVVVEADMVRFLGAKAVDVDADVVAIGIVQFNVLGSIDLHGKHAVACAVVTATVEEAQELSRGGTREALVWGDDEGHAISARIIGEMMPNMKATEKDWTEPLWGNRGCAVEIEVGFTGAGEAGVDKVIFASAGAEGFKKAKIEDEGSNKGQMPILHVTSRRNVPKANTSVRGDALPVHTNSGARPYQILLHQKPLVPTMKHPVYQHQVTSRTNMPKANTSVRGVALLSDHQDLGPRLLAFEGFGHLYGSYGYIDLSAVPIVFQPHLHHLITCECNVVEVTIVTSLVACTTGVHRCETIDVDSNMVVIDIPVLVILVRVELDSEEMVGWITVVMVIYKAKDSSGNLSPPVTFPKKVIQHAITQVCWHQLWEWSATFKVLHDLPHTGPCIAKWMCTHNPLCQCSTTQSINICELSSARLSIGLFPHVTSRRKMPKAYTSVRGVALPLRASSGARYPMWHQWFSYLKGSHGHIDLCGLFIVVHPYLHCLVATKGQIGEDTLAITIEAS